MTTQQAHRRHIFVLLTFYIRTQERQLSAKEKELEMTTEDIKLDKPSCVVIQKGRDISQCRLNQEEKIERERTKNSEEVRKMDRKRLAWRE